MKKILIFLTVISILCLSPAAGALPAAGADPTVFLTMEVKGSGEVNPVVGNYSYAPQTLVDINAVPATNWQFSHWSLSSSIEGPLVLRPDGPGSEQFVDSPSGNHYTLVNEEIPDEDQTYIENKSGPPDEWQRDLFSLPDPAISAEIESVSVYIRTKHNGTVAKACLKTHGEVYEVSVYGLTSVWRTISYTWTVNPFTGLAWTSQEIDDMEIGVTLCGSIYSPDWSRCTQVYAEVEFNDPNPIADVNSASTTIVMADDYSVTANFISTQPILTMAVNGGGEVNPTIGNHSYAPGTVVDITAVPATNWQFSHWSSPLVDEPLVLRPDGPGSEQFVDYPTGTHYTLVNEEIPDEDQRYIENKSGPPDEWQRDLFSLPDPAISAEIESVSVYIRTKHNGTVAKACLKTHGEVYEVSVSGLTSVWKTGSYTWSVNPFTGHAWTSQEIDDMEIGVTLCGSTYGPDWSRCTQIYAEVEYHCSNTIADGNSASTSIIMDDAYSITANFLPIDYPDTFGLDGGDRTCEESPNVLNAILFQNDAATGNLHSIELLIDDDTPEGMVRFGVYADNYRAPGSLLLDAGDVSVINGWTRIDGLNLPVTHGSYYWLAFILQSTNDVCYQTNQWPSSHCWTKHAYGMLPKEYPVNEAHWNNCRYVIRAHVDSSQDNTTPVAINDEYSVAKDIVLDVSAPGVLANDIEGFNNNDGIVSGASWTTGIVGGALNFNNNGDKVQIPDDPSLDLTSEMTIEAWIQTNDYTKNQGIVDKLDENTGYALCIYNSHLNVTVRHNNAVMYPLNASWNGVWKHVAATFSSAGYHLYVNGVIVNSGTYSQDALMNNLDLFIGNRPYYEPNASAFDGMIDDVRIYNVALSEQEIEDSYNHGLQASGIISRWEFEEGTGTIAHDSIGDPLMTILVDDVNHGTVTLNSDGSFVYAPALGYVGTDSFTYKVSDGILESNVATVSINITDSDPTFGLDEGTRYWEVGGSYINIMRFQNTAGSGTLTNLEILFDDVTPNGKVRLGVYTDDNGIPGPLLIDAGEVDAVYGWASISGLSLPVIENEYYWLAFSMQSPNKVSLEDGHPAETHYWVSYPYGPLPGQYSLVDAHSNSDWFVIRATVDTGP